MADAFEPRLSSAGSQARVVAPVVTQSQPSALQQLVGAAPDIANVAIRAKQAGDKREAAKQQAADEVALGQAIISRNEQLNRKDEAVSIQNDLFTLTKDVEKARADGVISADEEKTIQQFNQKFHKLKSAETQGLLDPTKFNIQSRKLMNEAIAKNPRIAKELVTVFNKGTGGTTSAVTGAAQAQQIEFNQKMNSLYGTGWTQEDVLTQASIERQVSTAKNQKLLGSIDVDNIAASTNVGVSESLHQVMTPLSRAFSTQQALTQEQIDAGLLSLKGREDQILRNIQADVFNAQKSGRIIDDAEVRALTADVQARFENERKWLTDRSLQGMLAKRNATEDALWKANLGGKINRFAQVAGTMGSGGMTAMQAMLTSSSASDRKAVAALTGAGESEADAMANFKSNLVDAMNRISEDQPVPGFEKLDAFIGIKAMKSGDVGEPVKQNTLDNITSLVETPSDAAEALRTYNDNKFARQIVNGDSTTKQQFINSVNANEAMIFSEIKANPNLRVRFSEEQFTPERGTFGRATPATARGRRVEVLSLATGGRGGENLNMDLTRKLNAALELHSNPAYADVLQPALEWLQDVTEQFQPIEQPSEQVSE